MGIPVTLLTLCPEFPETHDAIISTTPSIAPQLPLSVFHSVKKNFSLRRFHWVYRIIAHLSHVKIVGRKRRVLSVKRGAGG